MQGFIVIDKPQGWTSHDVVAKMRGLLKERKIGHLGTLDPLATGVLVLAVGRDATKQISGFMGADKEYEGELEFGKVSDTYDSEGKVDSTSFDLTSLTKENVNEAMGQFWGKTLQMPPAFSAKKVNGKKAYELARAGKPVDLKAREVEMHGELLEWKPPFLRFRMGVSSGTYIRSFAHDLGQILGCGAILTALRRTRVGEFTLEEARTIESFMN